MIEKRTTLQSVKLSTLVFFIIGCTNSSPIDTTITNEYIEPIDSWIIDQNSLSAIEIIRPELSGSRTTNEVTTILSNAHTLTPLDTDLYEDRELSDYPNDRGISPELIAFLKTNEPTKIFLLNPQTRRQQVLFDLSANNRLTTSEGKAYGDTICSISSLPVLDKGRALNSNLFEQKSAPILLLKTGENGCSDDENSYFFSLDIQTDRGTSYSIRTPIREVSGDEDNEITYRTVTKTFNAYKGVLSSAPSSLFRSKSIVWNSHIEATSYITYDPQETASSGELSLETPNSPSNPLTYEVWASAANPSELEATLSISNPYNTTNTDILTIITPNSIIRLDTEDAFNPVKEYSRNVSISSPAYESPSSTPIALKNMNTQDSGLISIIDTNVLKTIDLNGATRTAYTPNNATLTQVVHSATDTLVKEYNPSSNAYVFYLAQGDEKLTVIRGNTSELFTFPYQNIFDYVDISTNERYANLHDDGSPIFSPAISNSAWLPMNNYLLDVHEQYILHTDNSQDGLLRSPEIYEFDALEAGGKGTTKGVIEGVIASIEEAAIINERFGMIWVKESFDDDAAIQAYYFNPTDDTWEFTKVSEDTILPAWLPEIAY